MPGGGVFVRSRDGACGTDANGFRIHTASGVEGRDVALRIPHEAVERAHSIGVGPFDSPHRIDALDECLYTSLRVEGGEATLPVSHESVEMAGPDFCIVARSGSHWSCRQPTC